MINLRTFTAVVAVALTVASAPALAKSRGVQVGHEARAQAIETVTDGVSLDRAQALRDCNRLAEPIKSYTLITAQFAAYRSCMAQHGQPE
jgi:hypothetical protein